MNTKRCTLRPITMADAAALHQIFTSPGVRRFVWDDAVIPETRTLATIEQSLRLFEEERYGLWGVWPSDSQTLSGFTGLWSFHDQIELLYGLSEPLWGKGYATEVAQAVIAYSFDTLNMPVVRASTDAGNTASIRVLEKLGFHFASRRTIRGLDTVFFELTRGCM